MKFRSHVLTLSRTSITLISSLALFAMASCTTPVKKSEVVERNDAVNRGTATDPGQFAKHIETLQNIPIVRPLENPDKNEAKIGESIAKMFSSIQHESTSTTQGKLERGTHAKGSCFNGTFHPYSDNELSTQFGLKPESIRQLRRGVFANDGDFATKVRFANATGTSNSDVTGDVRGFSFVVNFENEVKDFSGESRQDFMFNNTPMFAVNNAQEFFQLLKTLRIGSGEPHIVNVLYAGAVAKAVKFAKIYQTPDTLSYAVEDYWSNLPYTHGVDAKGQPIDLVKFKAVRCDGQKPMKAPAKGKADNYLQADIAQRASQGQVCFNIQAQFFDLEKARHQSAGELKSSHPDWTASDWIENGGENWDENAMPFHTLAKVELKSGADQISCDDWYVNTRLHSNPANQPLGSVARVRTLIEEKSRARRMGETP